MFTVEVWDREGECWNAYKGGIDCAKEANALAEVLLDRGYFARVTTSH